MEVREVEDYVELRPATENRNILSRLVNYEPLSNSQPKLRLYPLDKLSSPNNARLQESLVTHDLLNALVGLSGTYIRYNNDYDPYAGDIPEFKIVKKMDASLKAFCSKVLKLGSYYVALTQACEKWSELRYGVVLQRLSFEIRYFLEKVYLKFIVEKLEREYRENPDFSIREFRQVINDNQTGQQLSILYNLYQKIEDEMTTRKTMDLNQESLNNLMSELNDKNLSNESVPLFIDREILPIAKGGVIIKILQAMIIENLGDRSSVQFMETILNKISANYIEILHEWMTQGELNDPHDEFMICNTMKNFNEIIANPIECDRIWLTQFGIRKDGLLSNFERETDNGLLFKMLTCGKLLNMVKKSLALETIPMDTTLNDWQTPPPFVELMEGTNFEIYINKWYGRANQLSLHVLMDGFETHKFIDRLNELFFNSRNSMTQLIKRNIVELTRQYSNDQQSRLKLDNSNKSSLVDQLLTVKYDKKSIVDVLHDYNLQENQVYQDGIINRSEIKTFDSLRNLILREFDDNNTSKSKDDKTLHYSNIYHLSIDCGVPYPINVVLNRPYILQYEIIGRYINLMNYHNEILEDSWIEINKSRVWRYTGYDMTIKNQIIKRCRLLHNQMNKYIKLLLEYITQDVIAHQLSDFQQNSKSVTSVDELQTQIEMLLTNILQNPYFNIPMATFGIIESYCKFLIKLRTKMIKLNYQLAQRYNLDYNETENIDTTIPRIIAYLNRTQSEFHKIIHSTNPATYTNPSSTNTATITSQHRATRLSLALAAMV